MTLLYLHENDKYFTEKLIKLKGCYQVTDNKDLCPNLKLKKNLICPRISLFFVHLTTHIKYNQNVFDIWMEILNTKKDSVLWLLEQDDKIKDNLLNAVAKYGIEKERIIF